MGKLKKCVIWHHKRQFEISFFHQNKKPQYIIVDNFKYEKGLNDKLFESIISNSTYFFLL
jgi:hypothetical protein